MNRTVLGCKFGRALGSPSKAIAQSAASPLPSEPRLTSAGAEAEGVPRRASEPLSLLQDEQRSGGVQSYNVTTLPFSPPPANFTGLQKLQSTSRPRPHKYMQVQWDGCNFLTREAPFTRQSQKSSQAKKASSSRCPRKESSSPCNLQEDPKAHQLLSRQRPCRERKTRCSSLLEPENLMGRKPDLRNGQSYPGRTLSLMALGSLLIRSIYEKKILFSTLVLG